MNQMGHGLPNIVGIEPGKLDKKVRAFLPGCMTTGQTGMGGMEKSACAAQQRAASQGVKMNVNSTFTHFVCVFHHP